MRITRLKYRICKVYYKKSQLVISKLEKKDTVKEIRRKNKTLETLTF
jgi:hypothetical protein